MKEIDQPQLIRKIKLNLDTAAYKNRIDADERIPSENK